MKPVAVTHPRLQSSMVTLDTVAAHAHVSKATASRVLGGRASQLVSPRTAERVRRSAEILGYKLNPVASALATGKSRVVALWVHNLDRPFYALFMREIAEQARPAGYEIIVQQGMAPEATQWPVDGVIAFDFPSVPSSLRPGPVVAVGEWPPDDVDAVQFDLNFATRQALESLIDSGRSRIAYLRQDATAGKKTGRYATVQSVLQAHRLAPIHLRVESDSADAGRAAVADALRDGPAFDALFCHNDELAIGALQAIHDAGKSTPDDIALVGCDGIEWGRFTNPPISTLHIPLAEAAAVAWETLAWRWANPDAPRRRSTVDATFVPRKTTPTEKESP